MNNYDVIIIGAGPAGLTAYNYLALAGLNVAVIDGGIPGGKLVNLSTINNYPSETKIDGPELALKMLEHSKNLGLKVIKDSVVKVNNDKHFEVICSKEKYTSNYVIIATGTIDKKAGIPGEDKFFGRGVSYCAICDGPLCVNKEICVIGDYDHALEETIYLSTFAKKIHLVCSRKEYANKEIFDTVSKLKNVDVIFDSKVEKILGNSQVTGVLVNNKEINVDYVFPFVGVVPSTNFASALGVTNERGFIEVSDNMETKVPKAYAVGDVIAKRVRQIVTACNDAAIAANDIIKNTK